MMLLVTLPVWAHVTFGDLCCSTIKAMFSQGKDANLGSFSTVVLVARNIVDMGVPCILTEGEKSLSPL